MANQGPIPTFTEENLLYSRDFTLVAGIDEVGRGALGGPVVAGAVILPPHLDVPWQDQVRDSKLLTPAKREALSSLIRQAAISTGVGISPPEVIDARGIARATRLAMKAAVANLEPRPQFLLIDYFRLPEVKLPQKGITDGDSLCFSIACASIVAKVARDRLMVELDAAYPGYGFAENKGYGTGEHLECLRRLGPCPLHRRSFRPVREVAESLPGLLTPQVRTPEKEPENMKRRNTGILGESLAARFLQERGYHIIETNYRCAEGEIDIVARHGDTLVFIEVRTKKSLKFGTPEESVTPAKKEKLRAVAAQYGQTHDNLPASRRIDMVAVVLGKNGRASRIDVIENAVGDE